MSEATLPRNVSRVSRPTTPISIASTAPTSDPPSPNPELDDKEQEHNPGLSSRIPYSLSFIDFTDAKLWQILHAKIEIQYNGKMEVEGGMSGLYMRVAVRRLARSGDNRWFGNARAVENLLATVNTRQARRITREKRHGKSPEPFLLTKEDLIGPEPDIAAEKSQAWAGLQKLIGLESVKDSVRYMLQRTKLNYRRELKEIRPIRFSLNQLFVGAPGTGKTTVAKLYGSILANIGLLSRGDVQKSRPKRFSERLSAKFSSSTRPTCSDAGDSSQGQDIYKTGVIDALVAMVQRVPGEDRCIILVGYEDKINNMFQNVNPGLSRRFPIAMPFRFENFDLPQLTDILNKKMNEEDLQATPRAMEDFATRSHDSDNDSDDSDDDDSHRGSSRENGVSDDKWAELEEGKKGNQQRDAQGRQLQKSLNAAETALLANKTAANKLSSHEKMMLKEKKVQQELLALTKCIMGYSWYRGRGLAVRWRSTLCIGSRDQGPNDNCTGGAAE
ncbi:hypothetical protein B0T17DRAFT_621519 [Bombardia bombarda]|uniref:CbbX AAA lid domain-containing protein n=1 Tax=Bombardia bombarda TaxID=252184 RepID=A0AA39U1B7_9PEZI|nr:hypothetical protein B0T17DRAFT_621519 [Bombardia bombarda]